MLHSQLFNYNCAIKKFSKKFPRSQPVPIIFIDLVYKIYFVMFSDHWRAQTVKDTSISDPWVPARTSILERE